MKLEDIISSRRAVYPKQMNGETVPPEIIDKILEMANWAPTHKNTEPWRFKVYADVAKDRLLDQCKSSYVRETPAEKYSSVKIEKIEERKQQVSHVIAICT